MNSASGIDTLILAALFGLLIGSFLNVVIYRVPKMLEAAWKAEAALILEPDASHDAEGAARLPFNLLVPRSRCGNCGHVLRWYENIPVLSYLVLRGKCSACHAGISIRYPLVELLTSGVAAYCAWRWGPTVSGVFWFGLYASLLVLALIDWDTTLLPDNITLPLMWAGLLGAVLHLNHVSVESAIWGAICGYMSLWLVYWAFKLLTGKEGMGYGDFKLLAALGAWFGWQALIPIVLIASVLGAVVGIGLKASGGLREGLYVPFGPFLAGAGVCVSVVGPRGPLLILGY